MNKNTLLLGVERMREAQRSAPSAPGGDSRINAKSSSVDATEKAND